jgi:hypothetical protein
MKGRNSLTCREIHNRKLLPQDFDFYRTEIIKYYDYFFLATSGSWTPSTSLRSEVTQMTAVFFGLAVRMDNTTLYVFSVENTSFVAQDT